MLYCMRFCDVACIAVKVHTSGQGYRGVYSDMDWPCEELGFQISVKVTDEDWILTLTNGLDDSYDSFIISLDSMPVS